MSSGSAGASDGPRTVAPRDCRTPPYSSRRLCRAPQPGGRRARGAQSRRADRTGAGTLDAAPLDAARNRSAPAIGAGFRLAWSRRVRATLRIQSRAQSAWLSRRAAGHVSGTEARRRRFMVVHPADGPPRCEISSPTGADIDQRWSILEMRRIRCNASSSILSGFVAPVRPVAIGAGRFPPFAGRCRSLFHLQSVAVSPAPKRGCRCRRQRRVVIHQSGAAAGTELRQRQDDSRPSAGKAPVPEDR